jgi:hypothetical protein
VSQLQNKFAVFYGTRILVTLFVWKDSLSYRVLNEFNPIQIFTFCLLTIKFNIILLCLSKPIISILAIKRNVRAVRYPILFHPFERHSNCTHHVLVEYIVYIYINGDKVSVFLSQVEYVVQWR